MEVEVRNYLDAGLHGILRSPKGSRLCPLPYIIFCLWKVDFPKEYERLLMVLHGGSDVDFAEKEMVTYRPVSSCK